MFNIQGAIDKPPAQLRHGYVEALAANGGQRKALLIGIDDYGERSLSGSVRDVNEIEKVLRSQLHINEIKTLLAPFPKPLDTTISNTNRPTRAGIIASIRKIRDESKENDFVYIHFSGHGCRVPTVYPFKKCRSDEGICCADNTIIRDIELAVILQELSDKGATVLATLDCCHSGGALRDGETPEWTMRQRDMDLGPKSETWLGIDARGRPPTPGNPDDNQQWFYGDQKYHLMAACQPHEFAREYKEGNEMPQGLFTLSFLQCLAELGTQLHSTPYGTLLGNVRAKCMSRSRGVQCPTLFGDPSYRVFGLPGSAIPTEYLSSSAFVSMVCCTKVVLDRGSSSGVHIQDVYELFRLDGTPLNVDIAVEQVDGLTSQAIPVRGTICQVTQGLRAKRIRRGNPGRVVLLLESTEAASELKKKCDQHLDEANPLQFELEPEGHISKEDHRQPPDFFVRIESTTDPTYEILDKDKNPLPNISPIPVQDGGKSLRDLCLVLKHLKAYFTVDALRPKQGLRDHPQFTLDLQPLDEEDERCEDAYGRILATCTIEYKNTTAFPVWITIFCLTAEWAIEPLILQHGGGLAIDPGEAVPRRCFEVVVPWSMLLLLNGSKRAGRRRVLAEKVKMFVTAEAHDFSALVLPSLEVVRSSCGFGDRALRPVSGKGGLWDVCEVAYELGF